MQKRLLESTASGGAMMRPELQAVLALAKDLPPAEVPEFLGALEQIRMTAFARITECPAMRIGRL
jgi:hypothetical protein